ncbi:polysaccharide pyruvyl transferase family protein [Bifidobacterium pullorum subsp. saeculare]|uniref:polysaccharide pyruvyl transferase family protein n=1 Tax=Bifidobacterium pullorum TaxID=78448 RepID=UPI00195E75DF|nr:polysaccharide pyruvyl transferase family protein [Bifidobacterium pullorum]MBM6706791.1 polysaccharide pyruvyl transferase family protein [Bifidobacterium pullorum subsp. saeculare]
MKIGILTHHYVKNFGAYMQAKALLSVIHEMYPSAKVEFINYRVKKHERANSFHFFGFKPKRGDTLIGFIEKIRLYYTHKKIEKTLPQSVRVDSAFDINTLSYDLIIVGSDEVWNFNDIAYSPIKFGYGINCPHVSYSASVGGSSVNDNIPMEVIIGIKSFKKIAVRDEKTEEFVEAVTGKKAIRSLDPVYLYNYKLSVRNKIKQVVEKKPYILIYDCKFSNKQIKELIAYARSKDYQILGAGEYRNWYSSVSTTNITPYEWAFLFQNAIAVVTGTFHGTSFAIKYNKPFVAYLTEQNRINKVGSLLRELKLLNRIVDSNGEIVKVLEQPIEYNEVNMILELKKNTSIAYLRECIDELMY